ncbi:exonuclease SbcCD subunit D C-terminal domain-containing protein [Colwellia sp. E2M01]|uniref:exonuclease SbcCD subunit D C-terminal domain-containing protein n=1 Tax=Colwellia sp. E2M01 TaxID=2841561 RepID=UPI001C097446|nr:exonuclease SbcCD subunit D C-terminal domain-containing protein [Colwellia sp. E2M01]MBU2871664.1 exonuclease subunit SbcD [Colwellia sp. E2M01]
MRIIHTSDWHLGQYFYGKSRANEHQQFLNWLLTQVVIHNIDAVIVAGDIFDTSTPPSYAREMYFDFIAELHNTQCQLIVLAGNHDSVAMLAESQSVLANLSTRVITKANSVFNPDKADTSDINSTADMPEQALTAQALAQQVFSLDDAQGKANAVICAIPFIRPRDVIKSSAGQSAQDKQQNLQQAISDHYQHLYQHALILSKRLAKEQKLPKDQLLPIIATGHLTALGVSVSDSKSDSVRDIYIGSLEAFPATAFPPADYIALGHIHRAQKVAKSEHIRYCGSPIPLSFDEANQEKRVLMVEFNQGKLKKVKDITIPRFQPMFMVKSSVDALEDNLKATLSEFEGYQVDYQQSVLESSLNEASPNKASANKTLINNTPVKKAWLDIEIDNGEHLSDLSQRVNDLTKEMPFEVLLVRRSKKARQRQHSQSSTQNNSTLSELSLAEVFDSRLSQLDWQTDEELARKVRLTDLFNELAIDLSLNAQTNKETSLLHDSQTDTKEQSNSNAETNDAELEIELDVKTISQSDENKQQTP